jgi:UDP-N-acetylglucosamine 2-epimerase (non-hydrolysing)
MKVAVVLGTRPEIIKFSPIIREFERLGLDYFVLHTGQHYSYNMDRVFFEQLELPKPDTTWMWVLGRMLSRLAKC